MIRLIGIGQAGLLGENIELPDVAKQVIQKNVTNYYHNGFKFPWCAYLAVVDNRVVGTCAFKAPIRNNTVEIAYFSFPGFEGLGYATEMAKALINIAKRTEPSVIITAQTLPEHNASTKILTKLNFNQIGLAKDPEVGDVWEWQLI